MTWTEKYQVNLEMCTDLKSVHLQKNDLSGAVDQSICELRKDRFSLEHLVLDCVNKISCPDSCCTQCK